MSSKTPAPRASPDHRFFSAEPRPEEKSVEGEARRRGETSTHRLFNALPRPRLLLGEEMKPGRHRTGGETGGEGGGEVRKDPPPKPPPDANRAELRDEEDSEERENW